MRPAYVPPSLFALLLTFCVTTAATAQTVKIMPAGDSITQGRLANATTYEDIASYRYFLWHQLKSSGYDVDFVGSQGTSNSPNKPHYNNFDDDHDGKWTDKAENLAARIQGTVTASLPDIILLHAGSSDLSGGQTTASTLVEIESIIDNARAGKADVKILLAQVIPFDPTSPFFADVTALNAGIATLASNKTTATSPIILVDHHAGWVPSLHSSFDGVHPYEIGELRMADTWHTALAAELTVTLPTGVSADFSASPTTVATSATVTFSDLSTGSPTSWLWVFGDGNTSTDQNPTHSYASVGTYPVNLFATSAVSTGIEIKADYITVTAGAPTADFTGTPTSGTAPLSVTFTNQSTGSPTSWLWEFGDTTTSTLENPPAHNYASAGTYTVKLTATNAAGSDTKTRTDYISVSAAGAPVVDFSGTPTSGVVPLTVNFSDLSTGSPSSWLWEFGDTNTSTSQNPSHDYTAAGVYDVKLTATNASGSASKTITGYITVTGTQIYKIMPVGDSVTQGRLANAATYEDVASYRYFLWHGLMSSGYCVDFVGSQSTVNSPNKPHYNDFDDDHEGKWSDKSENIAARIQAAVAAEQPDIILLHAGSSDLSGGQTKASTLTDITNIITNARAGKADVTILLAKIITFDPAKPFYVDVGPLNADLPGLAASLTTVTSPVIIVDHETGWDPVAHSSFDGVHPYEIGELRMANTWLTALAALIPTCGPAGVTADFSGTPVSGAAPLSVTFTDLSTGSPLLWLWEFGDGTTSTSSAPSHSYATPGTYAVNLSVTDTVGRAIAIKPAYITVTAGGGGAPTADFTGTPTSGTAPLSVTFTNQSTGSPTSWLWEFGDTTTSTLETPPAHNYASAGTYTVKLTATNAGGSDTKTRTDYITVTSGGGGPVADFTGSPTGGVAPLTVTFTNLSAGSPTSWLWEFGDTTTSTLETPPAHNYASAGTYTVKLTATNASGSNTKTRTDYITVTGSPSVYKIMPVGDSITYARKNPPIGYVDHASYRYFLHHLLTTSGRCFDFVGSKQTILSLNKAHYNNFDRDHSSEWFDRAEDIAARIQAEVTTHQPDIILLHAGSSDLSDGQTTATTLTDIEAIIDNARAGRSDVIILVAQLIPFGPGPFFADVTAFNSQLPGLVAAKHTPTAPVILVDHHTGWDPAIHSSFDDVHPYEIGELRMATTWHTALASLMPVCGPTGPAGADFSASATNVTASTNVTFSDLSPGTPSTWLWEFGDGATSTLQNPSHSYTTAGTYAVNLTVGDASGKLVTEIKHDYMTVTAGGGGSPVADFVGAPTSGVSPLTVNFTDQSTNNPTSWAWDFGDGGTSTDQNPTHVFSGTGPFTVALVATNASGSDTETKTDYITITTNPVTTIMPVGDSITSARHPAPYDNIASYRYFLWHQLKSSGRCVNFVGAETTPLAPVKTHYNNFDLDHEAKWNDKADDIAARIQAAVTAAQPDIILLHAGSSDLSSGQTKASTLADIEAIIDNARAGRADVTILVAKIIPFDSGSPFYVDVAPFNDDLPALVAGKTSPTSPVILVDHFAGWDPAVHSSFDGVHPFEIGELRMATTWHTALANLIPVCGPTGPTAIFSGTPTTGSAPLNVNFTDSSSGSPSTWLWEFGDGATSNLQNPTHQYSANGTYAVNLTVGNATGLGIDIKWDYITVSTGGGGAPTAEFTGAPTSGDVPLNVAFTDQSTGTPTSWLWDFGDGNTSTATNPSNLYNAPGSYTVKLTATNAGGSDTKTRTDYITVDAATAPTADFTGSPTSGDAPLSVSFTDASTDFPSSWLWEFGDGNTSTSQNPSNIYTTPGLYTVKLTATNAKGSDSKTRTDYITVDPAIAPTADFTGTPTTGDAPLSVSFVDASTGDPASWLWDFGDGNTSTGQSPGHIYTAPGVYTVKLTATNAKGSDSKTRTDYITVDPATAPTADFTGSPTTGDAPLSVSFTDASTDFPSSWLWEFGDGNTSTSQNPSNIYTTPGLYTVKLTATNAKGSDSKTRTDYIDVKPTGSPVAGFTGTPTTGDAPLSVSFTDQSTNNPDTWLWDFGDGNTSTAQNPSNIYSVPATYTVKLTATNSKGSGVETKTDYIVVSPSRKPRANFDGSPRSGSAPLSVVFNDQTTRDPATWLWEFGDGGTSDVQNPTHIYVTPGLYTVKLTATNSKGSHSKTRTGYIQVDPAGPPAADFDGTPTTGYAPLTVAFSDLSTNSPASWLWEFGDSTTSTSQNPSHVYASPGRYTVKLTATNSQGSDTKTRVDYIVASSSDKLRIMPLGDSITEARNGYATYRYFLWNQLKAVIDCADFVGSMVGTQGRNGVGHNGVPKYPNFDQDHEGHWGWRADEIADKAYDFAIAAQPDIVLCHIGSNDLHQNFPAANPVADMDRMIDELRRANPNVTIFLAQVIPFGPPFSINVAPMNSLLPAMVAAKTTAQSPVILVDHFTGWDPAIHSIDGVHPNETGEMRMANTWYQAMVAQGLACPAGFSKFGTGCAGSSGVPALYAPGGARPIVGTTFSLEVINAPANAPVIGIIGFDNLTWNGSPLPMDLSVIGMPGCTLYISYDYTMALTASGAGIVPWSLPQIPNVPALAGVHAFFQAAVGDPSQNALGVTSSNAGDARLGVK